MWHSWTQAEGLLTTARLKAWKKMGLLQASTATLLILALFMTELFVSFGSGEQSEVVQLEKWTKVLSPPAFGFFPVSR